MAMPHKRRASIQVVCASMQCTLYRLQSSDVLHLSDAMNSSRVQCLGRSP